MDHTITWEVDGWLQALEQWRGGNNLSPPRFIKPYHLVTMALTARRFELETELTLPPDLEAYAARMHLWEAAGIHPPVSVNKRNPTGRFLPAQPLRDRNSVTDVTDQLVAIAPSRTDADTAESLWNIIHELVENCFAHSCPDTALFGIACAQVWSGGNLAQIAIADPGVGIRATLAANSDYAHDLETVNACEFATEYGVSGKLGAGHSGYGMTLARDTLQRSNGKLFVVSQHEMVACLQQGSYAENVTGSWAGTLVVIEWRLDRPLDVRAVYDSWPLSEGFTDEDFDF